MLKLIDGLRVGLDYVGNKIARVSCLENERGEFIHIKK